MSVKLRLQRRGAKKAPFYRIVAADTRAPRNGSFLDIVGTYDPTSDPFVLRLKMDRVDYWLGHGAQATDTVASLLRKARRSPEILTPIVAARPKARQVPRPAAPAAAPATEEAGE